MYWIKRRSEKFMLALSHAERVALDRLAHHERISRAAVLRRLLWREAEICNLLPYNNKEEQQTWERNIIQKRIQKWIQGG